MMAKLENFGSLRVAHRSGGEPVQLTRSVNEVVFLAFDTAIKRLVELHLLGSGDTLDSVAKKFAFAQAQRFSHLEGASFTRILSVQETQGLVSYTSYLNDGEFITAYIQRRGPLLPTTAFALVLQLLDDVLQLGLQRRSVSRMHLDKVMMTTFEDAFLQLRVYDYDFSSPDVEGDAVSVSQLCKLLFLMLTGDVYAGQHPDRFPILTSLPMALRTAMRASLMDPATAPTTLEKLRDCLREAFGALDGAINAKNLRKQRVVIAALQPRSELQDSLLENMQLHEILGNRFQATEAEAGRCYPFSLSCLNTKNQMPVTVQVLPSTRIVDRAEYQPASTEMWGAGADTQPNVLRCLSLWQGPEWTFLTEERVPGFPLSRLLAERVYLNPQEVAALLRQVVSGQIQAEKSGVPRLDLHPSNIMLCIGRDGPLMPREYDRLMEKRLDVWPNFRVKVRAHWTMRHFYEAPLVERAESMDALTDPHYQSLMVVALAAYLLTGQRAKRGAARFPETTPPLLADFIRECVEKSGTPEQLPLATSFVAQFESLMSATSPAIRLAARLSAPKVDVSEMESVGSVSDFDNEWEREPTPVNKAPTVKISTVPPKAKVQSPRKVIGWEICAAAALVMVAFVGAWVVLEKPRLPQPTPEAIEMVEVSTPNKQDVSSSVGESEAKVMIPAAQVEPQATPAARVEKLPLETPVKVVHKIPQVPVDKFPVASSPIEKAQPNVAAPDPAGEVVRKAILPSAEEVERFKQSLTTQPTPSEALKIAFPFSSQISIPESARARAFSSPVSGFDLNPQ